MSKLDSAGGSHHRQFATTNWNLVLKATRESAASSEEALADLCELYWYPLYAFVRRQGYGSADAQDLTQGFFARLLEKRDLAAVDQAKGRFRSFLLASLKNYLINEWDRARAAKRGGGKSKISLDFAAAESRYALEPSHQLTAEAIFDREWGLTLLDQVRGRLRDEFTAAGREAHYVVLQPYLTGADDSPSHREVGERLEMSPGAVKVAVHRLRRRFRELLRLEISNTVADEESVDDEIGELFAALRG